MEPDSDLRAAGDRLQALLDDLRSTADDALWGGVEDALALVTGLYGGGLARVMEIVQASPAGGDLLEQLVDDDLVASLLVLHGLHPLDLAGRVQRALDRVRPYLGSHGGDVEILGVDHEDAVVHLRMLGSCDGCPSSAVTLELAVEQAIREAAPEIVRIAVEGAAPAPAPSVHGAPPAGTPVVLGSKPVAAPAAAAASAPAATGGWQPVHGLHGLVAGRMEGVEIEGLPVVFCRLGKELYAYRDACPQCGDHVSAGSLVGEVLRCGACSASYDVRLAGRSPDGSPAHLDPLPLVVEGAGTVRIAVTAVVS